MFKTVGFSILGCFYEESPVSVCLLPFFLMSFLSVLQQGGDDAASLNNSHGGLPSAGSASSTELNHQVETFRGQIRRAVLGSYCAPDTPRISTCMTSNLYVYVTNYSSNLKPGRAGAFNPGAEGGETGQGRDARQPLRR